MSPGSTCRCCMTRPPDKDLKRVYKTLGSSEVYADMLKDCFEIHLTIGTVDGDNGICEVCITRLRDACDFKHQVLLCQKHFQLRSTCLVKDESTGKVKEELSDDDDRIFFVDLNREMSDYTGLNEDEEDKKLVEFLGFSDVTVKKKTSTTRKRAVKKRIIIDKDKAGPKKALMNVKTTTAPVRKTAQSSRRTGIKLKSHSGTPLKISFRTMSDMNKLLTPPKDSPELKFTNDSMKHKANVDNILKYSNCTPFSNKTLTGIGCAYCKEAFQNIEDLRKHTKNVHSTASLIDKKRIDKNNLSVKMDITDLMCNVCCTKFEVISDLKKHLSKEHSVKFYLDVIDYIVEFKLTDDSEILNCALCNSRFETFKMLLQHMNTHYRNYVCDVCDVGFINKHRLKNHQRTHDIGSFKCTFCDKVFTTRVRKMCHEKYTHNATARYTTSCPHCDQSFTSYYQRNRHMFKEHNTVAATYKCNICDKSFILKSKLTAHIKKVHLMERNHICAECGQGFFIKQSLDEHMVKHNGERVFKCTVCQKAYARKKTLREHMRIHNNDRRFKCGICALAFVQKCSLKSHMLSNHCITLAEFENSKSDLCSPETV